MTIRITNILDSVLPLPFHFMGLTKCQLPTVCACTQALECTTLNLCHKPQQGFNNVWQWGSFFPFPPKTAFPLTANFSHLPLSSVDFTSNFIENLDAALFSSPNLQTCLHWSPCSLSSVHFLSETSHD